MSNVKLEAMDKEIKNIIEATSMGKLEKEAVIKSLLDLHNVVVRSEQLVCDHPKDQQEGYHDGAIKCNKCNCIIEQFGKEINPPSKLSIF